VDGIKHVRRARGVSLTELARRTGIFREQIAYAERAGTDPRASTLARLARGLGVPVCSFFDEEGTTHARHRRTRTPPRRRRR
jgi:transcriptional regulator with XRE-family HTH domain